MHKQTLALWVLLLLVAELAHASPIGSAFTYQGRLCDGGAPANGYYDFTFKLYANPSDVTALIETTLPFVLVTTGLFTTNIDFGLDDPFDGTGARWLEISARSNGVGGYVALTPRQELKPTPFAIYAKHAGSATTAYSAAWGGLTGIPAGFDDGVDNDTTYTAGEGLTLFAGAFHVSTNFFNGRYWALDGNAGTTPGTHFLGTRGNQALELKANASRVLRLEPNTSEAPNVIGGSRFNEVGAGAVGATIAGGGAGNYSGSFLTNKILSDFGSIGGGSRQLIERGANSSTIAGGYYNAIGTNANAGAIGGGRYNSIDTGTRDAVVAGGYDNDIGADADYAAMAGGTLNKIGASAARSFIGAGHGNTIASNANNSVIAGGSHNYIGANSPFSSIGGGTNNTTDADSATIPGGRAAYARNYGQLAYASGQLSSPGDAQTSVHVLRAIQTTGAGELFLDGDNRRMAIPRNSTWTFDILVVGRSHNGVCSGCQIRGVVENSAGAAAFVGTPQMDLLGPVPAPWAVTVNVIGDALAINTLAFNDRPVRWVATVRTAEITYTP